MTRLLLCLFFVFSLSAQRRPSTPQQGQQTSPAAAKPEDLSTLEGQVFDALTGAPLGKAALRLVRVDAPAQLSDQRYYTATSDASGAFAIASVEAGQYRLSATRLGYVSTDYGSQDYLSGGIAFTLTPGRRMSGVVLRMTPGGVITGRVGEDDGDPLAFVQVQALRYHYAQGRRQLSAYASGTTNDIGEYRVYGLPPGRYYVIVSPPHTSSRTRPAPASQPDAENVPTYYPGTPNLASAAPVDVGPGAQLKGVDLVISKAHTVTVRGHLTDAAASNARHPMIYLAPRGLAGFSSINRIATLDASGNFEFRGVPAGAYNLIATLRLREGTLASRLPLDVGSASLENVQLILSPLVNFAGRIRLKGDAPASPSTVQVSLEARDPMLSSNSSAQARDDGSLSFANVNPDLYDVVVSGLPDGYYLKAVLADTQDVLAAGLDLSRGAIRTLDVVLAPNAGVASGAVQNGRQQPAPGATVVLIPQETERVGRGQYYHITTTDASGNFTLKNLDPGHYRAYAWQDIEYGAWLDPDFMKPLEEHGVVVTIQEGSQETLALRLLT
jgi:hypothetical protein